MTDGPVSKVVCDDGTEIPFVWVYPGAEACEWSWGQDHRPRPLTPMDVWFQEQGRPGADRAWREAGVVPPPMYYRFQYVGPFFYVRTTPYPPERMAELEPSYRQLGARHGGALAYWRDVCQPRIEQVCGELASLPAGAPLRGSAELFAYGFHQTFTSMAPPREVSMRLTMLLAEHIGPDAPLTAFEVTQGGENASQAIDREIYQLAELARRTPAAARLLDSTEGADDERLRSIRREAAASPFVAAFDALIERHGSRSLGWDFALPTWRERPEAALSLVRAQLACGSVSPDELAARSEALRHAATERALGRLPARVHDEFARTVAELEGYVQIREDRAYWQMTIIGEVRGMLLRHGARLVEDRRIEQADDILFLEPDDVEGSGAPSDLRGVVAARRREWERWHTVEPPALIGTPMAGPVATAPAARGEIRGAPASRGGVTGTARILHGLEDSQRLRRGDILVCVMTTPAWTPLFAIAGGIVTETGGPLSHPAITAREYGIPAVLAVKDATKLIRDGQTVTIDGGAGVVSLGA